jgi:hypothetical protein
LCLPVFRLIDYYLVVFVRHTFNTQYSNLHIIDMVVLFDWDKGTKII